MIRPRTANYITSRFIYDFTTDRPYNSSVAAIGELNPRGDSLPLLAFRGLLGTEILQGDITRLHTLIG